MYAWTCGFLAKRRDCLCPSRETRLRFYNWNRTMFEYNLAPRGLVCALLPSRCAMEVWTSVYDFLAKKYIRRVYAEWVRSWWVGAGSCTAMFINFASRNTRWSWMELRKDDWKVVELCTGRSVLEKQSKDTAPFEWNIKLCWNCLCTGCPNSQRHQHTLHFYFHQWKQAVSCVKA